MRVTICAVGRLRAGPELDLLNDYLQRFDRTGRALGLGPARVTEVEDKKGGAQDIGFAVGIVFIVQTFFVKSILEDVLTPDGPLGNEAGYHRQLSGLLTFFFSVFYLQYIINRDIVGRRAVADVSQASRGAATAG